MTGVVLRLLAVAAVWTTVVYVPVGAWVAVDRWRCNRRENPVAVYLQRASNGHAFYAGITVQGVEVRTAQHLNAAKWTARQGTWKRMIDSSRVTIARWCRDEEQALRVERRMILSLSMLARLGGPIPGLGPRFVGNVEHNRRPNSLREAVLIAHWLFGYVLAGLIWRDAAMVFPWSPRGRR